METWTADEEKRLKELRLSPRRNAPEKLQTLVQHLMNNGTVWAVTEGDGPLKVSKDLARIVSHLTKSGDLAWVLDRSALPSTIQRQTGDKELGPHQRELYYFGVLLRDRLTLPRPDQIVGPSRKNSPVDLGLWTGIGIYESSGDREDQALENEWGFEDYDARRHSMFEDFRRHLAGARCWELLDRVDETFQAYVSFCVQAHEHIQSEIRALLPDLLVDDVTAMSFSLLANIYRPRSGGNWIEFDYAPVETHSGWAVQLGSWRVGREAASSQLEAIITAHRDLVEQSVRWEKGQQLRNAHLLTLSSIDEFRASLEPSSRLRRLIVRGHCCGCV